MLPQYGAVRSQKGAGEILLPGVTADKGAIIAVGDEADVLAVPFIGVDKPAAQGDAPDLLLGESPQREHNVGELLLGEGGENIALVLLRMKRLFEQIPAGGGVIFHPGIVAGGDGFTSQFPGLVQQSAELDGPVADHAGVWGEAGLIGGYEGVYHPGAEAGRQIQNAVGKTQMSGHGTGVFAVFPDALSLRKKIHGDSDQVISLLQKKTGRRGTVHTAAHGDGKLCCHRYLLWSFC